MEKSITLTVRSKTIVEQCPLHWSSNTVDYITATFDLDEEWEECDVVKAVWSGRRATIVTLLDADNTCTVPHEVLATVGKVNVNLAGIVYTDGEEFTRITTYPFNAITIDATAKVDGDETAPVTPSQFDQYVEAVKSETEKVTGMTAVAETLPTGSDATASYSDGVLSFGIPQGEQGIQGVQGVQGERGETGAAGNGIESVTKTGTSGLVDTYTILFTDGTSTTFNVTNGKDGSGADIDVDSELSTTSTNPVQNKVITSALNAKANTSSLASVATSGSYNDLSNKPTIPTVPTNVSAFTNDAHYITASGAPVQSVNGQTGNALLDAMDIETLDDIAVNVASGNPVTISNATNENAVKVTATLEPIQDLHGYDHPWAGGAGKNLFNYEEVESLSNIVNNNGTFTNAATDTRTYFAFTVQQYNGSTYVKGNNLNISASGRYSFPITVDSAITKLRIKHNGASKEFRFDFPFTKEGTFCVSVEVTSADPTVVGGVSFKDVMIESGSTMTAYEPYSNICPINGIENLEIANNGTTEVTVQLGQTVYGGTLNVTTGELTVDRAIVDLGTLTWVRVISGQSPYFATPANVIPYKYVAKNPNVLCERYSYAPIGSTGSAEGFGVIDNCSIRVRDTAYTDVTTFKTAMSGVQLCYELETPQTTQLTPAQLNLLTGTNVISTNADDLSVRYYASGKGNVEGSLTLLFDKVEELEERPTATTYTLSMSGNVITLTPSSGTATSVTLPVYSGGVTA